MPRHQVAEDGGFSQCWDLQENGLQLWVISWMRIMYLGSEVTSVDDHHVCMRTPVIHKSWLCVSFTTLIHHETPVSIVSSKGKVLICQYAIDVDHVHPAPHVGTSCQLQIVLVENLLPFMSFKELKHFKWQKLIPRTMAGTRNKLIPLYKAHDCRYL